MALTKPQVEMLPAGTIIQIVNTQTGAVSSGSTTIPKDDTIPTSTEGDQYMTLAITPTNASSKLLIQIVANHAQNQAGGNYVTGALYQDSGAAAIACSTTYIPGSAQNRAVVFSHYMTAGTTSSTTFKYRAGTSGAGTTTFNGASAAREFGGVYASSITITEIAV